MQQIAADARCAVVRCCTRHRAQIAADRAEQAQRVGVFEADVVGAGDGDEASKIIAAVGQRDVEVAARTVKRIERRRAIDREGRAAGLRHACCLAVDAQRAGAVQIAQHDGARGRRDSGVPADIDETSAALVVAGQNTQSGPVVDGKCAAGMGQIVQGHRCRAGQAAALLRQGLQLNAATADVERAGHHCQAACAVQAVNVDAVQVHGSALGQAQACGRDVRKRYGGTLGNANLGHVRQIRHRAAPIGGVKPVAAIASAGPAGGAKPGDAGRGTGRGVDDVVRGIGTADGGARQVNELVAADILVRKIGHRRDHDGVTWHARVDHGDRCQRCAVIDLVDAGDADIEAGRCDLAARRSGGIHAVVAGQAAVRASSQTDAGNGDRCGSRNILAVEGRAGRDGVDRFTQHEPAQTVAGNRRGGRAVINLVVRKRMQCQRRWRDLRGGADACRHRVVAGKPAVGHVRQRDAADRYRAGIEYVLAVEDGSTRDRIERLGTNEARERKASDRCRQGAVINLVCRTDAYGQRFRCNAGRGHAAGIDRVVAGKPAVLSIGNRDTADADGLADCGVLVVKAGPGRTGDELLDAKQSGQPVAGDKRGLRAVINLVGRSGSQRQVVGRDAGRCRRAAVNLVVAGQTAYGVAQRDAADGHGIGGQDILVVKGRAGRTRAERLARDDASQSITADAGGRCAVVCLVVGRGGQRQSCRRDPCRRCGACGHRVVAGQPTVAAVAQRNAADVHGGCGEHILVIELGTA